jgi:hypothetical protein
VVLGCKALLFATELPACERASERAMASQVSKAAMFGAAASPALAQLSSVPRTHHLFKCSSFFVASPLRCPQSREQGWLSAPSSLEGRVRCSSSSDRVGFLGRLGRVFKEKAKSDIQLLFSGFSKTRENLAVIDELLTYWNLSDSENILDELEEVLVCRLSLSLVRLFWFTLPPLGYGVLVLMSTMCRILRRI